MVRPGVFGERIKLAGSGIAFDIAVPPLGVKFGEPRAKALELSSGELGDFAFDALEPRHPRV